MRKSLEDIKLTIETFINEELIINDKSFITVSDFMINIEKYFNRNKVLFDKHKIKLYACRFLGIKLNQNRYNSIVSKGQRVYYNFDWKYNLNIIDEKIEIFDLHLLFKEINIIKEENKNIKLRLDKLENKKEKISKITPIISKSLNIVKNSSYSLNEFLNDYVNFSIESTEILYVNTIINDYIKCTNSIINKNILCKMLAQYIKDVYNNKMEIKYYKDLKYYKGLYYKI